MLFSFVYVFVNFSAAKSVSNRPGIWMDLISSFKGKFDQSQTSDYGTFRSYVDLSPDKLDSSLFESVRFSNQLPIVVINYDTVAFDKSGCFGWLKQKIRGSKPVEDLIRHLEEMRNLNVQMVVVSDTRSEKSMNTVLTDTGINDYFKTTLYFPKDTIVDEILKFSRKNEKSISADHFVLVDNYRRNTNEAGRTGINNVFIASNRISEKDWKKIREITETVQRHLSANILSNLHFKDNMGR